jgi:hypothetical protein
MGNLEAELDDLTSLNEHRRTVQQFLKGGQRALQGIESNEGLHQTQWDGSEGPIERSLIMKVQNKPKQHATKRIVDKIHAIRLRDDLLSEDREKVPVLLAARSMQALVGSSEHAFSRASILCYYRILREIFVADAPDWNVGGARAGNGGESTAYLTAQCIRAILGFVRTLEQIGTFFTETHQMYEFKVRLEKVGMLSQWQEVEIERMGLSWYTSIDAKLGEIALKLEREEPVNQCIDLEYINSYLGKLSRELPKSIDAGIQNFSRALREIKDARTRESRAAKQERGSTSEMPVASRLIRTDTAHQIAQQMVEQAVHRAREARRFCAKPDHRLENLGKLGSLFNEIAAGVKRSLSPATRFISTVLDRELAAASSENSRWDVRELAFAAAAFGATDHWQDERLRRACALLSGAVTEGGEYPLGRPFHSRPDGTRLHTLGFEVCECLALLLENVDFPVEPALVARMLQLFHRHKVELHAKDPKAYGWHFEHPPIPRKPTLWATALAVMALDRMEQMLNEKINVRVLSHFTSKKPAENPRSLTLDTLMYPDYGRRWLSRDLKGMHELETNQSVAMMLEMMRAHVLSVTLPKSFGPRIFSSVLYGPPGTGKTTLLEALACSCKVPLVELSPSDIAVLGQEAIESRARAIFKALSMLTRVVIIFDEFEPVLLRRDVEDDDSSKPPRVNESKRRVDRKQGEQRSMFTFLTPSMLPKLTRLHEAAEAQNVVYCLVTNHLEKLDTAAIREGRFDRRVGIYHPDLLSRAGVLHRHLSSPAVSVELGAGLNAAAARIELERSLHRGVVASAGMSVQRFMKRWLPTQPVREGEQQPVVDRTELLKVGSDSRRDPYGARLLHWEIKLWKSAHDDLRTVLESAPLKDEVLDSALLDEYRTASVKV